VHVNEYLFLRFTTVFSCLQMQGPQTHEVLLKTLTVDLSLLGNENSFIMWSL